MEIIPGVGLPVAQVGQTIDEIETLVGPATRADGHRAFWEQHSPPFAVYFDGRGESEIVEVSCSDGDTQQVTLDGIPLILRLMDDVEADLARHGLVGRRFDLVVDFDSGFTLWSLDEISAPAPTPTTADDPADRRLVVEGVAVHRPPSTTDASHDAKTYAGLDPGDGAP